MTLNDVVTPIEIVTYSAEEGTVNGHTVTRGAYATIHDACIALTVPYAQQVGGPILTHAVDTIGAPAEYWLHVHPDGQATPVPRHIGPASAPLQAVPSQVGGDWLPQPTVSGHHTGGHRPAGGEQAAHGHRPPGDDQAATPTPSLPRLTLPEFSVPAFHAPEYPSFDEEDRVRPDHGTPDRPQPAGAEILSPESDTTQQVTVADIAALDPRGAGPIAAPEARPEPDSAGDVQPDAAPVAGDVQPDAAPVAGDVQPEAAPVAGDVQPEAAPDAVEAALVEAAVAAPVEAIVEAAPAPLAEIDVEPEPTASANLPGGPATAEPFRSDPALLEEAWPLAPEPTIALAPVPSPRPDIFRAPPAAQNGVGPGPSRSARRHAAGEPGPAHSTDTADSADLTDLTDSASTANRANSADTAKTALPPLPTFDHRPIVVPAPRFSDAPLSTAPPFSVPPAAPAPPVRSAPPSALIVPETPIVVPTLDDLLATRPPLPTGPAQLGWRATVRHLTGGLIALRPNQAEIAQRQAVAAVQRSLAGPKTVVVINPKGGANKTTATLLIAATFGIHRGGYTLAWDNNETRGTMGWRARQGRHTNTAVDLLRELDRFDDARSARVGDLDNFVRSQGNAQFDVLASDEDATSAASIDADAFNALHHSLSRFYRIIVVDTGNNMRASNWDAALSAADQIVIVSTIREDTAQSAAWVADALNEKGYRDKVASAVTVLASPGVKPDPALTSRLRDHFGRLTRAVVQVPFDPALVAGGPIDIEGLSSASRDAWLQATAHVADGL
ncbi:MinD-like ATPase involved in chromosome partitioning or flagellar assembly [Nakamurella sp. UYEF19]|uniref:hypothetical protein n=1 Tax=Nakamurella sp. UYEF19 TaxID=1756392 RepID=UPI00339A8278